MNVLFSDFSFYGRCAFRISLSRRPVILTSFPTAFSPSSSKVEAMSHIKLSPDRAYIFEFSSRFTKNLRYFDSLPLLNVYLYKL